jgi:hypothetical protein
MSESQYFTPTWGKNESSGVKSSFCHCSKQAAPLYALPSFFAQPRHPVRKEKSGGMKI